MRLKRWISLLLVFVMFGGILVACGGGGDQTATPEPPKDVTLWYGYNTERFMQDEPYTEKMESRDSTLRVEGIRGDVESVQLMITPNVPVEEFDFEIDHLLREDGEKFRKGNFEILVEWYVEVNRSYNTDSYYGFYPDALVPLKAYKRQRLDTIVAGQNQGLWINVTIPEDTEPGFYSGIGTLEINNEKYEIPIEVTVYDAVMPEEVHPQSCFLIWYDKIAVGEGAYTPTLGDTYFWFLVEKRCMPMDPIPQTISNYDKYVDWLVENAAENPKISCYTLPKKWENIELGSVISRDACMSLLTKMAVKNVQLRQEGNETIDLFKKAFYYTHDEPSGVVLELLQISDQIISECKFAVADEYLKDYPDLYMSLIGLGHLVTTGYSEDLLGTDTEGGLQTWCPQFQYWHTEQEREQYRERQNTTDRLGGEEAWWYGCNNPKAPFPTYHLDDDLIGSRILSWMQYDYGSDGNLYWCVNSYTADMWETPNVFDGAVCEGVLVYPGDKFDVPGPLSTLRLESIREGMEDFEYLWMIEQEILRYNEANGTQYDPDELMAWIYADLYKGMIPVRDNSENFAQRRTELLEALETILADPAAGIALMEGK